MDKVKYAWSGEILDQVFDQYDRLDKAITIQRADALVSKHVKQNNSQDGSEYDGYTEKTT